MCHRLVVFPAEPPADSLFGRAGQGVSLQSGQTTAPGDQVAASTRPLSPGARRISSPISLPPPKGHRTQALHTLGDVSGSHSAECESSGGATWLQVTDIGQAGDTRPLVTETLGRTWGYHADDMSLAMVNLLQDVSAEETAWSAAHG